MSGRTEIRLIENEDGTWTARNLTVEVSAQGASPDEALSNLDAVVAAIEGSAGRPPTDAELQDLGIDPEENAPGRGDLPDILK